MLTDKSLSWLLKEGILPFSFMLLTFLGTLTFFSEKGFIYEKNFSAGDLPITAFVLLLAASKSLKKKNKSNSKHHKLITWLDFSFTVLLLATALLFFIGKGLSIYYEYPSSSSACTALCNKASWLSHISIGIYIITLALIATSRHKELHHD